MFQDSTTKTHFDGVFFFPTLDFADAKKCAGSGGHTTFGGWDQDEWSHWSASVQGADGPAKRVFVCPWDVKNKKWYGRYAMRNVSPCFVSSLLKVFGLGMLWKHLIICRQNMSQEFSMCIVSILPGTITYPLPVGTFESMIFRTSPVGVSHEGIRNGVSHAHRLRCKTPLRRDILEGWFHHHHSIEVYEPYWRCFVVVVEVSFADFLFNKRILGNKYVNIW